MQDRSPAFSKTLALRGSRAPFCFTKDGKWLLAGHIRGGFGLWDASTGTLARAGIPTNKGRLLDAGIDKFATSIGRKLAIRDLNSGNILDEVNLGSSASSAKWSPDGTKIAVVIREGEIVTFYVSSDGKLKVHSKNGGDENRNIIIGIEWSDDSDLLGAASYNAHIWSMSGKEASTTLTSGEAGLYDISFSPGPDPAYLAAGSSSHTIEIWDLRARAMVAVLEGHSGHVRFVEFSSDGLILASSSDNSIRFWRVGTWDCFAEIPSSQSIPVKFRFGDNRLALIPGSGTNVQLWDVDLDVAANTLSDTVIYKTAKIVLVGDSGVGKTGLGWRLAHGEFKEHASTHGQQFWVLDAISRIGDAEQQEAVLWDLAGQPDYRLIHALFLDDADVALVLCDPTHPDNPLKGVEYWLKQLRIGHTEAGPSPTGPASALVAARCDRGTARITVEEMLNYCSAKKIGGYFCTSAYTGEGIDELIEWMRSAVPWSNKPATVTTRTFKATKDFILSMKETGEISDTIITVEELRSLMSAKHKDVKASQEQILAAVGHLSNHGFVSILKTSRGETRVLLKPELLNNLAASFILEARRNIRGLGALSEQELLSGRYEFPESRRLPTREREIVIDSTITRFLEHNICLRETDPLNRSSYLIFPELINLKKPNFEENQDIIDDVSYTVSGATENVYSSLVVLLGYTNTFTRTSQWRNHARYEVGDGLVCGFRVESDIGADLDFVLYFGSNVGGSVKTLFKSLFESFLSRHEVSVRRYETVRCPEGHALNRFVVREQNARGQPHAFCPQCGQKVSLPETTTSAQLKTNPGKDVRDEKRNAERRSRLEQALFRLSAYITEQERPTMSCFISYAWGNVDSERWVERLATDLTKAGIDVIFDRWDNTQIGSSVPRFVERAGSAEKVIVVGTPEYLEKYKNTGEKGFIVAAEGDIISRKMTGSEISKKNILPLLLRGNEEESFPEILRGRVYADFRDEEDYHSVIVELSLSIMGIDGRNRVAQELRQQMQDAFSP